MTNKEQQTEIVINEIGLAKSKEGTVIWFKFIHGDLSFLLQSTASKCNYGLNCLPDRDCSD